MKYLYYVILIFILFPTTSHGVDTTVELIVGECNGNAICEVTEDSNSCPSDCSASPSSGGATYGYVQRPTFENLFQNIVITPSFNQTELSWVSSVPSRSVVKWGTTTDMSDGVLNSTVYVKNHSVIITNLVPGIKYYFSIESEDAFNYRLVTPINSFTTLSNTVPTQIGNPRNFIGRLSGKKVTLTWNNPTVENFSYVRIMRNTDRYHASPFIGTLVYEGKAENYIDTIGEAKRYYYSIFAVDTNGKFSSGVGVQITQPTLVTTPQPIIDTPVIPVPVDTTPVPPVTTTIIPFSSFKISQLGNQSPFDGFKYKINGSLETIIQYHETGMAQDMWLTLTPLSGEGGVTYIFSRNQSDFLVTIPIFEESNDYIVRVFKYNGSTMIPVSQGLFSVQVEESIDSGQSNPFLKPTYAIPRTDFSVFIVLGLFLIILSLKTIFRRK
jgi:hypothetical protein